MLSRIALCTGLLCAAAIAQDTPKADTAKVVEPEYINTFSSLQPDATLKPLEREAVAVATKIHGLGYGGAESLYEVQGEHSSVRYSSSALPPIIVKIANGGQDPADTITLYPLKVAKGQRQLQMMRAHLFSGAKSTMQGKQIPLNFAKYGDASLKVAPASPLAPGEYAIVSTSASQIAYCFGID
jgi:hypothetical protein